MKRIILIGGIVIIGLLVMITSCDLLGITTSIEKRIRLFSDDIQAENYTILYTHLHDDVQSKNHYKEGGTWVGSTFEAAATPTAITVTGTGDASAAATFKSGGIDHTITFTMKKDGLHWFILRIEVFQGPPPAVFILE